MFKMVALNGESMSLWDLRQVIEKAIPWWVPFIPIYTAFCIWAFYFCTLIVAQENGAGVQVPTLLLVVLGAVYKL